MLRLVAKKMQENTGKYKILYKPNQILGKKNPHLILYFYSIFLCFLRNQTERGKRKERKKERKKKEVPPGNSPSLKSHARRPMMKATILCMMACYRVGIVIFFLWLSLSLSKTLKHSLSLSLKLWNSMKLSHSSVIYIQKERRKKKAGSCNWMKIKTE